MSVGMQPTQMKMVYSFLKLSEAVNIKSFKSFKTLFSNLCCPEIYPKEATKDLFKDLVLRMFTKNVFFINIGNDKNVAKNGFDKSYFRYTVG